jgi:hypothetical protein
VVEMSVENTHQEKAIRSSFENTGVAIATAYEIDARLGEREIFEGATKAGKGRWSGCNGSDDEERRMKKKTAR